MKMGVDIGSDVDTSRIEALLGPSTDILTGYTDGMPHAKREWNEDQLKILRRHAPDWIDKPTPDMVALAKKNTYGDSETPARPFIEEGIEADRQEIGVVSGEFFRAKVEGRDGGNALKVIGTMCVAAVKKFILSDYYKRSVPNSWLTIAVKSRSQKGAVKLSDQPLVDTGQMLNATTYVIRKGGLS